MLTTAPLVAALTGQFSAIVTSRNVCQVNINGVVIIQWAYFIAKLFVCVFTYSFLPMWLITAFNNHAWAMMRSIEVKWRSAFIAAAAVNLRIKSGYCESSLTWYWTPAISYWPIGEELTTDAGWNAYWHDPILVMFVRHWGYIVKCSYAKCVWSLA